ncbi:MAG: O-antigen translocase [Acidobacteriota bacterium]
MPAQADSPQKERESSYGQILKSSALIGGSQAMNIAIGIVRTKAMALLLGPAGFGLFGLYGSVINFTQSIAGMGVNSSGVRQIAEAVGTGNDLRVAETATVLRRTSIVLGLLGALPLILFSRQISRLTFGTEARALGISILSIAVFFTLISGGQSALIQGTRRIAYLAKMSVLGALAGLFLSVPIVYVFRQDGVTPALVAVAATTVATSWWYSHKIHISNVHLSLPRLREEAGSLLTLGFAFMASSMMLMGNAYAVRVILLHKVGLEATGLYQSAWTLGGLYVSFILQSMAADFYPRLTASAGDHENTNRLVNEQARVSLLLAGPGVLATLTFAPLVISLFYSPKFGVAVEILRWICLGVTLQVMSWPMGFIIMANGRKYTYIFCEAAWTAVSLGLALLCIGKFGLNGAGIAFFGSYLFHVFLIYPVVGRLSGFRWSSEYVRTALPFLSLIALVFVGFRVLPFVAAECLGAAAAILSGLYSVRTLAGLVAFDRIPWPIQKLLAWTSISRPEPSN